jgi:hypothetical protein
VSLTLTLGVVRGSRWQTLTLAPTLTLTLTLGVVRGSRWQTLTLAPTLTLSLTLGVVRGSRWRSGYAQAAARAAAGGRRSAHPNP